MSTLVIEKSVIAENLIIGNETFTVRLTDGRSISIPYEFFPTLRQATMEQLHNWRLIGGGEGIHWEDLDEDILVAGLL